MLSGTGIYPIFPVWGRDTKSLAGEMIASGVKEIVTSVNPAAIPPKFAGWWFDRELLAGLPAGVDPSGEYSIPASWTGRCSPHLSIPRRGALFAAKSHHLQRAAVPR